MTLLEDKTAQTQLPPDPGSDSASPTLELSPDDIVDPGDTHRFISEFISRQPITRLLEGDSLSDAPDGLFVDTTDDFEGELPKVIGFEKFDEGELGAANSHHGVAFGRLFFETDDGAESSVKVAVKPFSTSADSYMTEYKALVEVTRRGFDAFLPVGIGKDGDIAYLITLYKPEVDSLDNVDWTISPSDADRYETEIIPNLHFLASTLAVLHANGIFHGDAQAKNIARSESGKMAVIDLEDARITGSIEETIELINIGDREWDSGAYSDITHAWYALIHQLKAEDVNVFLQEESVETCMSEFVNNFLSVYVETLREQMPKEAFEKINIEELTTTIIESVRRTT